MLKISNFFLNHNYNIHKSDIEIFTNQVESKKVY